MLSKLAFKQVASGAHACVARALTPFVVRRASTKSAGSPPSPENQRYIDLDKKYGCQNYAPIPVVVERAQGLHVWDVDGKQYMDFLAAYSAVNQGHCHPRIKRAMLEQIDKVTLTSRAFYNKNLPLCLEYFNKTFGYDKTLFMNTGCEAVESGVKFARRWAYNVKGVPDNQARVLFARGNFWGRSIAACGSSEDPDRFWHFGPFDLKFDLVAYNDIQALELALESSPHYAAFVLEPIQGEKGVIIPSNGYLKKVKEICDKHRVLMIVDEIQTGLGRTGQMLASDWEGVRPHMVTLGKALSGGYYPVSALLTDSEVMDQIKPGHHGSTYGGNPLGTALAVESLKVLQEENMIENSRVMGERLVNGLKQLKRDYIKEIRGRGLFAAIEFRKDSPYSAYDLCMIMKDNGVLAKPTHHDTIRLSPPLIITEREIDQALDVIAKSLTQLEKNSQNKN